MIVNIKGIYMLSEQERENLIANQQKADRIQERSTQPSNYDESMPPTPLALSEYEGKDDGIEYSGTWYRWVILFLFSGLAFNANMIVASFNSLVDPL